MPSLHSFSRRVVSLAAAFALSLATAATLTPVSAADAKSDPAPIRIKTGITKPLTDETGVVWLADQGFADGDTIARPELEILHTKTPSLYRAERYSMTKFALPLPNGRYLVKLHFAETFEGITGPRQRVFSYTVEGKPFKDFDVFAKSGGANRAYVETVEIEIKDGQLDLTFTPDIENPQINALEILPRKTT